MQFIKIICFFVILFLVNGQNHLIKKYSKELYKASGNNSWISEDNDGQILVANDDGLLKYNGNKWKLLSIGHVNSIAKSDSGEIYLSTESDIGILKKNDTENRLKY